MALSEIHGTNGGRDERGLGSLVVPFLARTLDEVFNDVPAPLPGYKETARIWTHGQAGTFTVDVTFEGSDGDPDSKEPAWSCQASFIEQPVEAHPQIEYLIKRFNGQRDPETQVVKFPATLEGSNGTNALAGQDGIAGETKNPLAGLLKYMELSVVWEKKYISKRMPSFALVGRVVSRPPGNPPTIPNRNVWLVLPPVFTLRGTVYDITEQWQLMPEGTPPEVYNLGIGPGSNGGLLPGASPANLSNAGDYFGGSL